MEDIFDPNSVRKVVSVQASPEIAWRVFRQKMGTWWPLAVYKIGKANAVDCYPALAQDREFPTTWLLGQQRGHCLAKLISLATISFSNQSNRNSPRTSMRR